MSLYANTILEKSKKLEVLNTSFLTEDVYFIIWLVFLIICMIGFISSIILLKRNQKVGKFRRAFYKTLYDKIMFDVQKGVEPTFSFDDVDTHMWSYEKMYYRFWIKDFRKMFYNTDLFDYVYDYAVDRDKELKNAEHKEFTKH